MLKNFQLAAIAADDAKMRFLHIPLHQALQKSLAESWQAQYEMFMNGIQEIDFNAGYMPEEHERFCLKQYQLPEFLNGENGQTVSKLDSISADDNVVDSIKGIVAFARDEHGAELMLFQHFSRSNVIRPGRFLFLKNDTYESVERPGITLEWKLSAIYFAGQNKLLFQNFRMTNTFLPLSDFYKEASEHEIREVLNHDCVSAEDPEALAVGANQWFRKRFAMLKDSGTLDKYTAKQIKAHANGYEIEIRVKNNKIVFPANKAAAKRLLQFLNEELFRGAITETLYETNSKKEAD